MLNVFWSSFFRSGRTRRPVSIMLFLGLFVTILCVSIILGSAYGQYDTTAGYSSHGTLTVDPGADLLADLDGFAALLYKQHGDNLANVLYLTKAVENEVLIGWQGTQANRWFAYGNGRFFTEQEQQDGANVVFISREYYTRSDIIESMEIGGETYQVVGSGWIVSFNFQRGISNKFKTNLFGNPDVDPYVQIIPYKRFISNHTPVLILVHFDFASSQDLKNYAQALMDVYPETQVHLPNQNADETLESSRKTGMTRALIISALATMTLIQLAYQWGALYKKELYVYRICGMTRLKCLLLLLGHWSVYFAAASAAAIAVHLLCFPLLHILEADFTPQAAPLLSILLCLYGISAIFAILGIGSSLSTGEKGDVL